jgi:hypothetical protein
VPAGHNRHPSMEETLETSLNEPAGQEIHDA